MVSSALKCRHGVAARLFRRFAIPYHTPARSINMGAWGQRGI